MSATDTETTTIIRDLGDHGTLEYRETARSRGYYLASPGEPKPKRLVSVTTVLGILAKPALLRWSEDWGARGALAAVRMGELDPKVHHDDEAVGIVRTLGLGADAAKSKAATRGLTVHDSLQSWAEGGDLPDPADMDPEHRPYLRGLMNALLALDPEPTVVEQVTCHPELGFAGRLDLRAIVDGQDTILDLATNISARGYPEKHVQCRGYESAEMALGAPPADRIIIIGVGAEGQFNADECTAPFGAFERVLEVQRMMADVGRPLDAMKRAEAKARKAAA